MTLFLLAVTLLLPTSVQADTYVYDQYGRLTCVAFTAGGRVTYTYDDAGNRTERVDATSTSCP